MKTVQITGVRFIKEDKNGNPINLFVMDLANGKPSIVRKAEQFLTDLRNSFLIGSEVKNPNHPSLLRVLRDLKGATVTGDIHYAKAGDQWTVTENSSVVTDKNHPKYGDVVAGDKLAYEKDQTLILEGFLTVDFHPSIDMRRRQADAYGDAQASMLATDFDFGSSVSASATDATPQFDANDIDDSVLAEVTATEPTKAKGK